MRKVGITILALLALPALLFVYNPSWQLEGFGMLLGAIGMTISPLIIVGFLLYVLVQEWRK